MHDQWLCSDLFRFGANCHMKTNIDVFLLHDFIISYCHFVSFLEFQNTHDSIQLLSEKDVEKNIRIACLNGTNYGEVLIQLIGFWYPINDF